MNRVKLKTLQIVPGGHVLLRNVVFREHSELSSYLESGPAPHSNHISGTYSGPSSAELSIAIWAQRGARLIPQETGTFKELLSAATRDHALYVSGRPIPMAIGSGLYDFEGLIHVPTRLSHSLTHSLTGDEDTVQVPRRCPPSTSRRTPRNRRERTRRPNSRRGQLSAVLGEGTTRFRSHSIKFPWRRTRISEDDMVGDMDSEHGMLEMLRVGRTRNDSAESRHELVPRNDRDRPRG